MARLVDKSTPIPEGFERVHISSQLGALLEKFPEDIVEKILYSIAENVEVYERNVKHFGKKYNLKAIYEQTDEVLKKFNNANPVKASCKKGCAFCCKMEVMCSRIEAEYALKASEKLDGIMMEDEMEILRKQVELSKVGTLEYALSPDAVCVFLTDDNECSIYEQRPMACRNYQVTGDPARCDVIAYPKENVAVIAYLDTEAMRSVLINADSYKLLSEHILDIYKEREQH